MGEYEVGSLGPEVRAQPRGPADVLAQGAHKARVAVRREFDGGFAARLDLELPEALSNEQLLELYALYKQATEGDVSGSRPGLLDLKGRAKFDAWAKAKGTGKDEAMKKYVALVDALAAKLG